MLVFRFLTYLLSCVENRLISHRSVVDVERRSWPVAPPIVYTQPTDCLTGHAILTAESPDPGWADSGKDSPIQTEDNGKISSSPREDLSTPVLEHDGTTTKTVGTVHNLSLHYTVSQKTAHIVKR